MAYPAILFPITLEKRSTLVSSILLQLPASGTYERSHLTRDVFSLAMAVGIDPTTAPDQSPATEHVRDTLTEGFFKLPSTGRWLYKLEQEEIWHPKVVRWFLLMTLRYWLAEGRIIPPTEVPLDNQDEPFRAAVVHLWSSLFTPDPSRILPTRPSAMILLLRITHCVEQYSSAPFCPEIRFFINRFGSPFSTSQYLEYQNQEASIPPIPKTGNRMFGRLFLTIKESL